MLALALGLALAGCRSDPPSWEYGVPEATDDGWRTASLDSAALDPAPLHALMARIDAVAEPRIHGIAMAVDGRLVLERYWSGHPYSFSEGLREDVTLAFDRETPHGLASVTKSVTATLLGIAIERKLIESVHERVLDFFPELKSLRTEGREEITLEHLVTMTAGLQWDEQTHAIGDARNDLIKLVLDPADPAAFVLGRPRVARPGERFAYSGGSTNVLGEVIGRASGLRLDRFAEERLFAPLEMREASWEMLREDFVYASGDLKLRLRDVLKLGQLYLQDGVWRGERLLSDTWVAAAAAPWGSFRRNRTPDQSSGYGYGWWVESDRYGTAAFAAHGWGGQAVVVLPEHGAVVAVSAGAQYQPAALTTRQIIREHVLPALRGS